MRVVFDSNVLLAAFGTHGLCESLFSLRIASHDIYVSQPILDEVNKYLATKLKASPARVAEVFSVLASEASLVEPADVPSDACRDPNDLMVLGTAVIASANYIVTGDKDLLSLGKYKSIAIVSPREFYEILK